MTPYIFLLMSTSSWAQMPEENETTITADPAPAIESQSIQVEITLTNGIYLTGEVPFNELLLWQPGGEGQLQFTPTNGQETLLPMKNIATLQTLLSTTQPEPPAPEEPKDLEEPVSIEDPTIVDTPDTAPIPLSIRGFQYSNPAASRYLYAPSSIGLQKGQGYVSQKLVFTTGVYAISDNVTILLGAFGPFATVVGTKVSKQIQDNLYIGGGAEVFFLPLAGTMDDSSPLPKVPLSIFFGSVTYGDLDQHITIASGYIHDQLLSQSENSIPIMIAGHKRIVDRMAVVTENWLLLEPAQFNTDNPIFLGSINSLAFRIIGRRDNNQQVSGAMFTDQGYPRSTWDIGLVLVGYSQRYSINDPSTNQPIYSQFRNFDIVGPMPWIDYTWHFGPARQNKR